MTNATSAPPRAWPLLATVTLVLACPSDDTVQNDGSGTNSTVAASGVSASSNASNDATGAPPLDACMCAVPWSDDEFCGPDSLPTWVPGCPETTPCSYLRVECSRDGGDLYSCRTEVVFDEVAMQCMLETLRDGTPARLELDGTLDYGVFSGHSRYVIHVLEGRTAVQAGCIGVDIGSETFGPTRHTLADADYFTACMDVATPADRYDCLLDGLGEGTDLPACPS